MGVWRPGVTQSSGLSCFQSPQAIPKSPTPTTPQGWQLSITTDMWRRNEINECEQGRYAATLISAAPTGSAVPSAGTTVLRGWDLARMGPSMAPYRTVSFGVAPW